MRVMRALAMHYGVATLVRRAPWRPASSRAPPLDALLERADALRAEVAAGGARDVASIAAVARQLLDIAHDELRTLLDVAHDELRQRADAPHVVRAALAAVRDAPFAGHALFARADAPPPQRSLDAFGRAAGIDWQFSLVTPPAPRAAAPPTLDSVLALVAAVAPPTQSQNPPRR